MSDSDDASLTGSDKMPLFVERQTYRRRRIVDAARALPILGLLLWWVPLLWALPEPPHSASGALIYIFAVWLGLVLASGMLIAALRRRDSETEPAGEQGRVSR